MTLRRSSRRVAAATSVLAIATSLACPPASAATRYQVTDLGTLGGNESDAIAMNARGTIVGFSTTAGVDSHYRAFASRGGAQVDLGGLSADGDSFATALNANDVAVGYAVAPDFNQHAVIYRQGQVVDIGALRTDFLSSTAAGVNRASHVVGTGLSNVDYQYHAFIYAHGAFRVLDPGSHANAINDADQVTGSLFSAGIFVDHGVPTLIGTLGGSFSEGVALNRGGTVTGWAATAGDAEIHAFTWRAGAIADLGTLGGWQSRGEGIDTRGRVVGWSYRHVLDTRHAFLYRDGRMIDLNAAMDPVSGAGWELVEATAIDDAGHIVGSGTHDGFYHAFLLTPTAE